MRSPPDKERGPATASRGTSSKLTNAQNIGCPPDTTGSDSAQVLGALDPQRFPILNSHWPFQAIGDAASSFIERLGQRCIQRAEAEGDFEAAEIFRNTLDRVHVDEPGEAA